MNIQDVQDLIKKLLEFREKSSSWLNNVPMDIREAFYDNEYVNFLSQENDLLIKYAFQEYYDDVSWFLYDWQPGCWIEVESKRYEINNLGEFIKYLEDSRNS